MFGGWEIGKLAGISVRIHWSFLLLPAIVAGSVGSTAGAQAALGAVLFILAIFGCVVLHELGHALAARRFGIGTQDITLLPIGGVARLQRMPRQPLQELVIAVAGPAVNVVIAVSILIGTGLGPNGAATLLESNVLSGSFLGRLFWANVGLVIFNLLPAFPMDGGRVLRSVLAMMMPYTRATDWAAAVATVMAVLFGLVGLLGNPLLILIALFVFMAARGEAMMVRMQPEADIVQAGVVQAGDLMQQQFLTVPSYARVSDLAAWMPRMNQRDFPVLEGQRLVGMLRDTDVSMAMASGQRDRTAADLMRRDIPTVLRNDALLETYTEMERKGLGSLPVADAGGLVGLLSRERVRRWMESLQKQSSPSMARSQL
ncbi:MAG: site-2 protease family protein [Planctomycetaceae bacterium]|nr:MAG: site-2 protease family protein [Planctomycetaceae bacterium]